MSSPAVEVFELVKSYGSHRAVDDISFSVERGQLLALLGTNGAGKTTTIEICEGFRTADSGVVRVLGQHPATASLRPRVGVMLQDGVGGYTGAKAREMLALFAAYAADPLPVDELLAVVGLSDAADRPVKRLSGGQQQRLSLAMALVGRPELLFLDEPTTGMDPQARRTTWELIRRLRGDGVGIVLTTHYLDEAEGLADDVVVLHAGQIVAHGSPAELTHADSAGKIRFSARPGLDVAGLRAYLATPAEVREETAGQYLVAAPVTPQLLAAVTAWCARENVLAEGLTVERRRLEDVFLALTAELATGAPPGSADGGPADELSRRTRVIR
ncbi:ABC transporter ATP-binding protein [Jatrophihabitans telluris]|uniref:ABC transporter ATP-binding protein n=1 Tax=Jatrophihabitans telluris TaxID=2038343 RepID=A0ABY4R2Y5_9ACTN|nr:ABC transporter ATP-binding protein [Jatrophihabitans telluris]UQX90188.1 ABC transporter ATP-binding protein [Jatrophihabitans telluris]